MSTRQKLNPWSCVPCIFFTDIVERRLSIPNFLEIIANLGLDGVEMHTAFFNDYSQKTIRFVRKELKKYKLTCSVLIGNSDFTYPEEKKRKEEITKMKKTIDFARAIDCLIVRLTAGQAYPHVNIEQGIKNVVSSFEEVVNYGNQKGVTLAFENHYKDYFWQYPDFTMDDTVYIDIWEKMKRRGLKINFDSSNPIMAGYDGVEHLRKVINFVVNVHLSDRKNPGQYQHYDLGEGVVDFSAIFKMLKTANYQGYLSIEYNGKNGMHGLKKSITYAKKIWREVPDV